MKILLIEDDEEIIEILTLYLTKYNMEVFGFTDPLIALDSLKIDNYDLVILDLSLPNMDGLDVCKILTQKYNLPIIISTARSDVSDRVIGLELGADDYLPKPYDPRELVARIQSVTRRTKNNNSLQQSEFIIDEEKMLISKNGTTLDLTLAEYEILRLFLQTKQMVLSREYISNNADSIKWDSSDKSIDVIVSRLRHKIDDTPKHPKYIKSIRGVGYKFIGN
jgi:two-component system OmpR family response regulator